MGQRGHNLSVVASFAINHDRCLRCRSGSRSPPLLSRQVGQMSRLLIFVLAIIGLSGAGNAQTCTIGGSINYCGYSGGKVSGGFSTPCSCNKNFCCSQYGYCGPQPGILTDPQSAYCGTGCQSQYGTCSPGDFATSASMLGHSMRPL